jgi:hypothetical protein
MSKDRNELILNVATEGFRDWDLKSDRALNVSVEKPTELWDRIYCWI